MIPRGEGHVPGQGLVAVAWASTVVFAATAVGDRLGLEAFEAPATVVALVLFGAGIVVWTAAFAMAVVRSARDRITISGVFFLQGSAPRAVRIRLLGALAATVVVAAATASEAPFGVLEPVFPLALAGLWGARYGAFEPRRDRPRPGTVRPG